MKLPQRTLSVVLDPLSCTPLPLRCPRSRCRAGGGAADDVGRGIQDLDAVGRITQRGRAVGRRADQVGRDEITRRIRALRGRSAAELFAITFPAAAVVPPMVLSPALIEEDPVERVAIRRRSPRPCRCQLPATMFETGSAFGIAVNGLLTASSCTPEIVIPLRRLATMMFRAAVALPPTRFPDEAMKTPSWFGIVWTMAVAVVEPNVVPLDEVAGAVGIARERGRGSTMLGIVPLT